MKPNNPVTPEVALIADLAKFDSDSYCEGCGAPLWAGDDYVTDPDGVSGCWAAMTDLPSKQPRPCYAYRVGRPSAGATMVGQGPDVEAMRSARKALQAMMDAWLDYHDAHSLTQPATGAAGNAFDLALAARDQLDAALGDG